MEYHDEAAATVKFGVTPVAKVLFHSLCFSAVLCIHLASDIEGMAVSQKSESSESNKPTIYIDIPRWENRTAYPRFLIYRDHFRRRLENRDTSSNEAPKVSSYSKLINASHSSSSDVNDSAIINLPAEEKEKHSLKGSSEESSLEQLLAEQRSNGVIPVPPNDPAPSSNVNSFTDDDTSTEHDKEIINFPKDKTNPCNRLQINPEDENNSTKPEATSVEDVGSFEIGNRQNFPGGNDNQKEVEIEDEMSVELIKDVVPTVQLTMKIIQQSQWDDENVVFSPLSIANVLSILLLGAEGDTFKELSLQLGKDRYLASNNSSSWSVHRYHEAFQRLLKYLKHFSGDGVTLNSASEIFLSKHFPINDDFKRQVFSYYDAPLEQFNFGKDGSNFVEKLNKWVREKTENQIQRILEEAPSPDTTMGIINAIYFKGPWDTPFSEKLTRWRDFHVQPKEKIKAQMMINILKIPFIDRDNYRMTAVPYKGNNTALFLILPKGNNGLSDLKNVERTLTRQELNESLALMEETKVALTLPKLKFSSDGEMVRILENMGLSSVFNGKANFSGISPDAEGLFVNKLLHRAVVEINEKGTEASAVTLGTIDRILDEAPIPFGCDKPFLFFISNVEADTILFWGRVVRPEAGKIS